MQTELLIFLAFTLLLGGTLLDPISLRQLGAKPWQDWVLDGVGLFIQGILIPLLQITVLYQLYRVLIPGLEGVVQLPPLVGFGLSFVLVDYLYYWNHRCLHRGWFWSLHQVHHTVSDRDVLGTSRNSLWSSFFILYLWIHSLAFYLLQADQAYAIGVSLTAALDLWRHSAFGPASQTWLYHWLSAWFILPQDHAWHHAHEGFHCNYGANFKWWDRLHGTAYQSDRLPAQLGIPTGLSLTQKILWPWQSGHRM